MNFIQKFYHVASMRLEQIALITERSQMSYGDVLRAVKCFDTALAARGVQDGQTIVLQGKRLEFIFPMALLASLRSYRVIFADPAMVVRAGISFDWILTADPDTAFPVDRQIQIEPDWFQDMRGSETPDYSNVAPELDGFWVFHTSGSTGEPKFVESAIKPRMDYAMRDGPGFVRLDMTGRRFCTTVAPGASWAMMGNMSVLLAGGSVVSLSRGNAQLMGFIDLYRVDCLITTPVILSQLLNLDGAEQFLTSLRDIRIGGALVSNELVHRFAERFGINVHIGYGSTEFGATLGHIYDPTNPAPEAFLGATVNDDVELSFYDENYEKLPDDVQEGIVGLRRIGTDVQRKYLAGADGKQVTGIRNGVFFPGDIMRREKDGYFFVGRNKNIVNVSGNKYSLDRIVSLLASQFPMLQMAPIVEADANGLELVMVIVAGGEAPERQVIEAALRTQFTGLSVSRVETTDALPLTQTHKIDFLALRAKFT